MAVTIDDARKLVADAALWPRVRETLWDFAPQVHASWLEGLAGGPTGALDLASPRVKAYVLEQLGVKPHLHLFPKEDWSRLVLLPGATLLALCEWLGVLAYADTLRQVTNGATVRSLKAALPGVYPEAFGYCAYFGRLKSAKVPLPEGETPADDVLAAGYRMLLKVLAKLDGQLVTRFRLKLPKAFSGLKPLDIDPKDVNLALLMKLKFPEAYDLCYS